MMDQLIAGFPDQLLEALELGKKAKLSEPSAPIHNVLVIGLGGSGMGANVAIELTANHLKVPMAVSKHYHIPAYVGANTLLIASSYSGNTEETLMALEAGIKQGAQILCITSAGKMKALAEDKGYDFMPLPPDSPSPRANLGFSFIQQLCALNKKGLISDFYEAEIIAAAKMLKAEEVAIKEQASELAEHIFDKIPIIYSPAGYTSIAIRWRQQINENGKMLCWHHEVPEMNHNELVGWREQSESWAPIFFMPEDTFNRTAVRMEINKSIISEYANPIYTIQSKGNSQLERMMYISFVGDWLSWFLAKERGMDALEVDVIDFLKGELAKV